MSETNDLLLEVGTEELPPKALYHLDNAFEAKISSLLAEHKLPYEELQHFSSPRRLAVLIKGLAVQQPDTPITRKGPALAAAFDNDGNPTKAALGFAKSCGVEVSELEQVETDKGSWLSYHATNKGLKTSQLLEEILKKCLDHLPIPKRMRWGSSNAQFVRPVQWLIVLFGDKVIPMKLFDINSNRFSYGHRFHHPEKIELPNPVAYQPLLESEGKVLVSFAQRRAAVKAEVEEAANKLSATAIIDPDLLDEVTGMVEWPQAITGHFEQKFLSVPQEALIASMQGHQKFFPVVDNDNKLLSSFITISNIESKDPLVVQSGNERVIRPRLADASFFWDQDRKHALADKYDKLKKVVFHKQLGSLADKTERVTQLASTLASQLQVNNDAIKRAAYLAKCDLLTNMVIEFPELQGIMGRYYALHDGETNEVATAIYEQYLPRFAGDKLPESRSGEIIAIAERVDTLVGIFSIGEKPTGDKDPFGLRRAALGVLRIIIEKKLDIDLYDLITTTTSSSKIADELYSYLLDRLKGYYQDEGIATKLYESVRACTPRKPYDFHLRIEAVANFTSLPEAESLSAANKRIHNILRKVDENIPDRVDSNLLTERAEKELFTTLSKVEEQVSDLLYTGNYNQALKEMASLHTVTDDFFDNVMVMADNQDIRVNRLALLSSIRNLFLQIADLSHL